MRIRFAQAAAGDLTESFAPSFREPPRQESARIAGSVSTVAQGGLMVLKADDTGLRVTGSW